MIKKPFHIILAAMAYLSFAGCALYPAVQVAGGAMTSYDAVVIADDIIPRDHVDGGGRSLDNDKVLERRLRERLRLSGLPVSAHVFDANAYLVGQFPDRTQADSVINIAKSVQGLNSVTCKFYQTTSIHQAGVDAQLLKLLALRLAETKRLEQADLRVEVIDGNAILIGETTDFEQKTAAVAIAYEVGGIQNVVDYIVVVPQEIPEEKTEKTAMK